MGAKKIYHILSLSGGKDSSAMCIKMLSDRQAWEALKETERQKTPEPVKLDYVIFCDTGEEFREMYAYLDKLECYLKTTFNQELIRLKPNKSFTEIISAKIIQRGDSPKNTGKIRGLPSASDRFCTLRREAKVKPSDNFIKSLENGAVFKENRYRMYIGITTDEAHRVKFDNPVMRYPLYLKYKWSEKDCYEYLKSLNLLNPLYKHFKRTGCYFCPYQSRSAFKQLYKHYKPEWEQLKAYEKWMQLYEDNGDAVINKTFFMNYKSAEDMEKAFNRESELIDSENSEADEFYLKECECGI